MLGLVMSQDCHTFVPNTPERQMSETTQQLILDFDEYIRQGEPSRAEKAQLWQTAIGLQAVDGLSASDYLKSTARKHIEGEISIDEVRALMKAYYEVKSRRTPEDAGLEEADRAAANIAKVLSSQTLDFSTKGFVALHRRIFEGVFKHAGQIRDYDISKREWVLDGASVSYLSWEDLRRALDYDIAQERNCSYKELSDDEKIVHIARFVSGLWQIHPFGEGNTRTTAVFAIQYLRSVGFEVDNEMFARHSWYFRNALVRANYKNVRQGIDYSPMYLERFFRNLLLGERWDLRSRYLHIHPSAEWRVQPKLDEPEGKQAGTGSVQDEHGTSMGAEQDKHGTSIGSKQDKLGTSSGQARDKLVGISPATERLLAAVGEGTLSVREMMVSLDLSGRDNFLRRHLAPAIAAGYLRPLYPDVPRHPQQRYSLTEAGLALWRRIVELLSPTH